MSLGDWLNLLVRWVHLIAGIAWIGSSFYFIWLDSHLEKGAPGQDTVEGSLWMVHSGGFYQVERRRIGPGQMPHTLHWFKWEAAITWMTGVMLLMVVYYLTGGIYLLEPGRSHLTSLTASLISFGIIMGTWAVYDLLWQSPLAKRGVLATALSLALAAGITLLYCHLLSGRAAFIHVGATLGTLMVANVWMRILPAQRRMIDATAAGRTPDFSLSDRAKTRSVHNSYMTFPVLFIMLSNHFPALFGARQNALVLILLMIVGGAARHVMIGSRRTRLPAAAAAVAALGTVIMLVQPAAGMRGARPGSASGPAPAFAEVQAIVQARCTACHSQTPRDATFGVAPAGVSFDDPENIRRLASRIYVRAVVTKTMPLANKTGITEAERGVLGAWIEHGAPAQ